MDHLYRELQRRERADLVIQAAVVGIGSMGRGIVGAIHATAGMRPALLVSRGIERAIHAYVELGVNPADIIRGDDRQTLDAAVRRGIPAVTTSAELACEVSALDVVVEATGTVEYAARTLLAAVAARKHVVVMNAEVDSALGCLIAAEARAQGVVYTAADGDQPGVTMRLIGSVQQMGFELVAAANCKGFLNTRATPNDAGEWAERLNTTRTNVCAFTDGTKMNMENASLANATGLVPEKRGMHGIATNLKDCLADFDRALSAPGVVDYTIGGDFGGGVLVIGRSENRRLVGHYLDYLKMGAGPNYLFFRPYHLCHLETPRSIAEAVIYEEATMTPMGASVVEVVAIAKRDLHPGDLLDGIGGFTCYGEIDTVANAAAWLPMALTDCARIRTAIAAGNPIPFDAVDLNPENLVMQLRNQQARL